MRSNGNGSNSLATSAPAPQFGIFGESPEPSNAVDGRRVWKVLVRRRRLLIAVFAGFFVAVMLLTLLQPRSYMVSTKLIAGSSSPDGTSVPNPALAQFPILAELSAGGQQSAETYAELLSETPVFVAVIQQLGLKTTPAVLSQHLTVKPVTNTSILNVSFSWKDPVTAARIANALAGAFVDSERKLVSRDPDNTIVNLDSLLPAAEQREAVAQNALAAYEKETGVSDLTTQTTSLITANAALEAKLKDEEVQQASATQSLAATNEQLAATPQTIVGSRSVAPNPVAGQLQSRVADDRIQLKQLESQYQPDYPPVIQAKASLAEAEKELASQPGNVTAGVATNPNPVYEQLQQASSQYAAQAQAAQAQVDVIQQQLSGSQPKLDALPEISRRVSQLVREVKASQDILDAMNLRLQNAKLAQKTALADIAITQPADPASFTTTPNTLLNALLGLIVGAVLALSAVFIVEFFDDRMRTIEDVRERLALPVLATIPRLAPGEDTAADGSVPKKREPDWVRQLSVESFYQLVASLRYTSTTPPRTIAFTSAQQGDGKSTVAVNTAISMALMNARVLVIDADLRRPSVHLKLAVPNERGLSDALVGLADFTDVVKTTGHEGVWVVTSGRRVPNPFSLLQSEAFDTFVQRARERFDFVIVDGPALSSIVDGLVIGLKTDGTVLVVNADSTEGRSAQAALAKLRAVPSLNIIGVVLNGTRPDPSEYSDYYLGDVPSMALPRTASR